MFHCPHEDDEDRPSQYLQEDKRQRSRSLASSIKMLNIISTAKRNIWHAGSGLPTKSDLPFLAVGPCMDTVLRCRRLVLQQLVREQTLHQQSSRYFDDDPHLCSHETADCEGTKDQVLPTTTSLCTLAGAPYKLNTSSMRDYTSPWCSTSHEHQQSIFNSEFDDMIQLKSEQNRFQRGAHDEDIIIMLYGTCLDDFLSRNLTYESPEGSDNSISESQETIDSIDCAKSRLLRSHASADQESND